MGSKADRSSQRAVNLGEAEELALKYHSSYGEVSSKTRENVRKPFVELVDQIVNSTQLMSCIRKQNSGRLLIGQGDATVDSSCGC